jgi:hypothetical protein
MPTITAFLRGAIEFRSDVTWSAPGYDLALAYDWGREWAHRLTFRRWDA